MIHYKKDADNIVYLTLDMKGKNINVIGHAFVDTFQPVLEQLIKEKKNNALTGVILTSAKRSFVARGDLQAIFKARDAAVSYAFSKKIQKLFKDLEAPDVPVVAAINGTALGLGFELALACHHRVVIDKPTNFLGHPEVQLGLSPCGGGTIRLLWLVGIEKTYHILTQARHYSPRSAYNMGIIDELATDRTDMIEKAKRFIFKNRKITKLWNIPQAEIPYGSMNNPKVAARIRALGAKMFADTYNQFPAQTAILSILMEASKFNFDTGCDIESRYFTRLSVEQECYNLVKVFWYQKNKILNGLSRPKGFGKFRPRRIGVIGAGVMGSGIAFNASMEGLEVVIKDISELVARRSKEYASNKLSTLVAQEVLTKEECTNILNRIIPTAKNEDFEHCDLVIEAVYENKILKTKVTLDAEKHLDEYSFMATNTVSIPISELSQSSNRPTNYIGLHFFAPVEDIPLVEIVKGKYTSDETVARAFDFIRKLNKIPIVVKDSWGFYASRVKNIYILEGIHMLQEGYPPALIENVCRLIGMVRCPLELADEIGLKMILRYENQAAKHYGSKYIEHPAAKALEKMIDLDRTGGLKGGFYQARQNQFWPELQEHFPVTKTAYDMEELKDRIFFAQVLEASWCYQEKVIHSAAEANLGSIHGWGFPSAKGGVFQFVEDFEPDKFIQRAKDLEAKYGPRFIVPKGLLERYGF